MRPQPIILVALLAVLAALFMIFTSTELPARVACHFDFRGNPDDWMARESYLAFMVIFVLTYPALMTLAFAWLPRQVPSLVNIPRRDYWLAPERREESLKFLVTHGCWFSCLMLLAVAGIHYAIVIGHRAHPPALPLPLFFSLLGCLGFSLIVWTVKLLRRFPKPVISTNFV